MSAKKIKQFKRQLRKEIDNIKIEGLEQFIKYSLSMPLNKRIVFAVKIIFKALKF
jgi:hypothetical protein